MMHISSIKTTLYMRRDILEKLTDASYALGMSRTRIVSMLLARFSDTHRQMITAWRQVRYQERRGDVKWHRLHVSYSSNQYEFVIDLRKVCKLSVSRIVAYAIEKLLDSLLCSLQGTGHHNTTSSYVFSSIQVGGVVCWLFCWGIPPESPLSANFEWT